MATQGQRRAEGRNAIRKFRQEYRKADSAGESLERELDRLIKRKTLIGPDELATLAQRLETFVRLVDSIQRLYATIYEMVVQIPR